MAWTVELLTSASKQLKKLDPPVQARILRFLRERVVEDPRRYGKPLSGSWRAACATGWATTG